MLLLSPLALYQGMTSVMPKASQNNCGLQPLRDVSPMRASHTISFSPQRGNRVGASEDRLKLARRPIEAPPSLGNLGSADIPVLIVRCRDRLSNSNRFFCTPGRGHFTVNREFSRPIGRRIAGESPFICTLIRGHSVPQSSRNILASLLPRSPVPAQVK